VQIPAHGLLARVLQHEIDHLDGILFIDRIPAAAAPAR
jgi:peptide deformylase